MNHLLFEEEILKILGPFLGPSQVQFLTEWIESHDKWENINHQNCESWFERLEFILKEENPQLDRYFVLLAGLIVDIESYLDRKLLILKKASPVEERDLRKKIDIHIKHNKKLKAYLLEIIEAKNLLRKVLMILSDEEKSAIIFLRNKYSHPVLTSYRVQLEKNDKTGLFEFDMKKYLTSKKNLTINQVELYEVTKRKVVAKQTEISQLRELFEKLRKGEF